MADVGHSVRMLHVLVPQAVPTSIPHAMQAVPSSIPGEEATYHYLSYGWLLGGLVEKVTGRYPCSARVLCVVQLWSS